MPEQMAVSVPTNKTFAEEVKADRLKALYRVTGVIGGIIFIMLMTFGAPGTLARGEGLHLFSAALTLIAGCFATAILLEKVPYSFAAWTFVLTAIISMGMILYGGDEATLELVPFIFPVIIFIAGLLLSPFSTLGLTLLSAMVVTFVPGMNSGLLIFGVHQGFAILLMFLSAGLGAQVTGELYQITQWALDNYQKERRTNDELFEKRQALQSSLQRSEALGERLREINTQLEVANREAEEAKHFRGQFLANMSHELRTPLNAIIGFSETMLQFPIMYDNESLPQPYEKDLGQIYSSGRQLLHVINDILDLAKVDAGKLEIRMGKVDPAPVVNAVMSTAKGLLGTKTVRLEKDTPDPMPEVWVDETRLRQVLLNLYSNACKYTDEGVITLKVRELPETNEVEFAIKDTGVGIDPEFHDKLFQEFQQAKNKGRDPRSGSGLGLAISKQLLDLMEGRIWMTSKPGEGSTFTFTIKKFVNQDKNPTETFRPIEMNTVVQASAAEGAN
jgi:signal transduction histidine kinase